MINYSIFGAQDQELNAPEALGRADEVGASDVSWAIHDRNTSNDRIAQINPDDIDFRKATEWVDNLFEERRDMQRDTEATTLACRHNHLSGASRRLLNGAILPCHEVSQQRILLGK